MTRTWLIINPESTEKPVMLPDVREGIHEYVVAAGTDVGMMAVISPEQIVILVGVVVEIGGIVSES